MFMLSKAANRKTQKVSWKMVEQEMLQCITNRPFSHCLCACVYRSRGALFLDNRRDFTEMGQTDFKPLILSM